MIKFYSFLLLTALFSFGFTVDTSSTSGRTLTHSTLKVGDKAPEIMLTNPEGEVIALSSLVGKVVYVHFWASWCAPCRKENATVVQYYEKFKNKKFKKADGFVVYSVSLDYNKNKWLEAIAKDGLNW